MRKFRLFLFHSTQRLAGSRHGGILLFVLLYVVTATVTRVALLAASAATVSWDWSLAAAFAWGLAFDFGAAAFAALPLIALLTFLPGSPARAGWPRIVTHAVGLVIAFALLFGAAAEWFFWEEFSARFNFIAVDYLVYTKEVVGNIRESYPMPWIFAGIGAAAVAMYLALWRTGLPAHWMAAPAAPLRRRLVAGGVWFIAALGIGLALDSSQLPPFANNYNRELAKDGLWSLFAAFRNNELDYRQFYATLPDDEAFTVLREELVEDGSLLLKPTERDTLRFVSNPGPEKRLNVIQITVESLSADFLGIFNKDSKLTPNLDALAAKSLVFENLYATGTRTDRGMEALALSMPPTPGRSIIKRPHNESMFTLGSVFRSRGYDTAFIYGGFGYFDNMNYFFGNNGYRVVDRNVVNDDDVTFANVWGACDEDLLRWTAREADASYATGRPFHYFVMTTSNHRPYTFPEGRIDMPSKTSGRAGGVKYTDYAIGKFLRDSESKPWFKNTVFVIVADHCASVAGRHELEIGNYHIPMIVYSPGGQISPGRIETLTSQMDYAPTLLGLLNWSYPTRFFGHDVRKIAPRDGHALIGNYQKLGHLEMGEFQMLGPMRVESVSGFDYMTQQSSVQPPQIPFEPEAVAFYQTASYMFHNNLYHELTGEDFEQIGRQARPITTASSTASAR
jgi:phosphoglycerol transferase MdoB-like AlkP superfamily enzyme